MSTTPDPIPVGAAIVKTNSGSTDGHQNGATGVIASIYDYVAGFAGYPAQWTYFVAWDDMPGVPVFTIGQKLERAE